MAWEGFPGKISRSVCIENRMNDFKILKFPTENPER